MVEIKTKGEIDAIRAAGQVAGGNDRYLVDDDGWTIRTADGSRAAHVEHTIAVTASGPVVLTVT